MKKIIYLAVFILASFLAKGQYPVTQTLGTDSTIISVKGAIKGRTIIYSFTDTAQANTQRIKGYAGALIFTKNALWFRDSSIKRWVQILPSGNSNADTMYYRIGGNATVPVSCIGCDPKFGFKGNNAINVITNNTTRFIIPADGFSALSSTDSKYLGVDTVTGNMGYLSGGGGGGTDTSTTTGFGITKTIAGNVQNLRLDTNNVDLKYWKTTGNAISSGQFLGTTNNQDLVFKRNNVNSGIISSSSTALGRFSLSNLGSGISNSAFGSNSLSSLTSGANNSSFGSFSMQENTSGSTNSAFGSRALNINNTGNSNTALGSGAMSYNLTGSNNTSLGFESLGENITGNNNLGLGFRAGYHSDYNPSNKLFINSLDRLTSVGDSTLSIIYGVQDSLVANQRLKINGKFHINDGTQGAGKVFTDVNGDGIGSWVSPTSGGTDTSTTVGFGLTKTIAGNVINLKVDTSVIATPYNLSLKQDLISFPFVNNKYLNGYGDFPTLNADSITNGNTNKFTQWTTSGADIGFSGGSVGIGTISPVVGLHVESSSLFRRGTGTFTQMDIDVPSTTHGTGNGFSLIGIGSGYSGSGILTNASAVLVANSGTEMANGMAIGALNATGTLRMYTGGNNERMRIDANGNIGIATSTINSRLDVLGSFGAAITTTTSNLTLDDTHHTIIITGSTPTITLPAAGSTNTRREYVIVNQTGTARTISSYLDFAGAGATTIAANSSITIQSNGTNWYKIQ